MCLYFTPLIRAGGKKVHALYFKKSIGGAVEEGNEKLSENYGPTIVDEWDKFLRCNFVNSY